MRKAVSIHKKLNINLLIWVFKKIIKGLLFYFIIVYPQFKFIKAFKKKQFFKNYQYFNFIIIFIYIIELIVSQALTKYD